MKKISFFPVIVLLCVSCNARLSGSLMEDGQADLQIYTALEPRITRLIGILAAASGTKKQDSSKMDAPILDGPAIAASMAHAPGIASVSLKNTAPAAIEGPVKISKVGDFLSVRGTKNFSFIDYKQSSSAGGSCTVNLSLDSGPEILALISPDIVDYLSALMAPLATGEKMTTAEYLADISAIYGSGIADEISKALVRAAIDFPGAIQSVKGGTFSGKKAEFTIPLVDILVLEKPLSYEVIWK